jgi:HSP20 family protein
MCQATGVSVCARLADIGVVARNTTGVGINIELTDDVLSLSATRKTGGAENEQIVSFARSFNLPYAVQADKISAELKDGILRLALPKAEAAKPRKIAIN